MSYLNQLKKVDIENAISQIIKENSVNTEGIYWVLKYKKYHFSPNVVIRKAGEIKDIPEDELHKFTGGNGPTGAITKLKALGFEIIDKRVKVK
jgi:hypothetical protein